MSPKEFKNSIIKRPKFRSRFEVYVFNKEVQHLLEELELRFMLPGAESPLLLSKKMMFQSEGVAILVASVLDKLLAIQSRDPNFNGSDWLEAVSERCRLASLNGSEDEPDDWIPGFVSKQL